MSSTLTAVASSISVQNGNTGVKLCSPGPRRWNGFAVFPQGAICDRVMTVTVNCPGFQIPNSKSASSLGWERLSFPIYYWSTACAVIGEIALCRCCYAA